MNQQNLKSSCEIKDSSLSHVPSVISLISLFQGLRDAVSKPHLRNLFYRVQHLYLAGVSLVVVVDGEATPLKWSAMDHREGRGGGATRKTGQRRLLNSKMKEVCPVTVTCFNVLSCMSTIVLFTLCS